MKLTLTLCTQVRPAAFQLHALRHDRLIRFQHKAPELQRMCLCQRGKFAIFLSFMNWFSQ